MKSPRRTALPPRPNASLTHGAALRGTDKHAIHTLLGMAGFLKLEAACKGAM